MLDVLRNPLAHPLHEDILQFVPQNYANIRQSKRIHSEEDSTYRENVPRVVMNRRVYLPLYSIR